MSKPMNTYTDTQLKQALAKMLPELCIVDESFSPKDCEPRLRWLYCSDLHYGRNDLTVLDTELLHLCWLVEDALNKKEQAIYLGWLYSPNIHYYHATWQQRVGALAKVKGVEIV
jgi:hypothetical protein